MRPHISKKTAVVLGATVVLLGAGAGAAIATSDDSASQQPITGPARDRATRVALAETGGGRVTETEVNDEESYYQVEVTLDDGSHVDVNLDRGFNVVKTKHEGAGS
jgi:hypothetical protein